MIGGSRQSVNRLLADFVARACSGSRATSWSSPIRAGWPRPPADERRPGPDRVRATGRSMRSLAVGARLAAADRLAPPGGEPALHAIADAAVAALGAPPRRSPSTTPPPTGSSSGPPPDRQGGGVVGLSDRRARGHRRLRVLDRPAAGDRRRRRRPALRAGDRRADRLRAALAAGRPARRRRRDRRRPRGARPARRPAVRPARPRAGQPRSPRRRRSSPGPAGSSATRPGCSARRSRRSPWTRRRGRRTRGRRRASTPPPSRPCSRRPATELGRRRPAVAAGRPDRPAAGGRSGRSRARGRLARRAAGAHANAAPWPAGGAGLTRCRDDRAALPAWSEAFAADARSGLGRDRAVRDDRPRGGRSAPDGRGVTRRDHRLRRRGGPSRRSAGGSSAASGSSWIGDGAARRSTTRRRPTWSATARPAPGSSTPSRRPPSSCRSGSSGPTTAARAELRGGRSTGRSTQGVGVVNLSLSSRSEAMFGALPRAGRRGLLREHAARLRGQQRAGPSYPSLFAAVVSVAAHDVADPDVWFYNPAPPVEFGAYGLDVDVAWRDGGARSGRPATRSPRRTSPAGRRSSAAAHPDASPFEVKAMLAGRRADDPPDMTTPPGEVRAVSSRARDWVDRALAECRALVGPCRRRRRRSG